MDLEISYRDNTSLDPTPNKLCCDYIFRFWRLIPSLKFSVAVSVLSFDGVLSPSRPRRPFSSRACANGSLAVAGLGGVARNLIRVDSWLTLHMSRANFSPPRIVSSIIDASNVD